MSRDAIEDAVYRLAKGEDMDKDNADKCSGPNTDARDCPVHRHMVAPAAPSPAEGPTPLTDAIVNDGDLTNYRFKVKMIELARSLERQLAAARAEAEDQDFARRAAESALRQRDAGTGAE